MILAIVFILICGITFLLGRKERRAELTELKKENRKSVVWPVSIAATGLWTRKLLWKLLRRKDDGANVLFEKETERTRKAANVFGGAYLLGLLGGLIGLSVSIVGMTAGNLTEIARPSFGETKEISAVAKQAESSQEVLIEISGKQPVGSEWDAVFDRAFEALKPEILGDNESFSNVQKRLSFPRENDVGIRFSYKSRDPEVLSDYGSILAEELPFDGVWVDLTVTLNYEEAAKTYTLPVKVCPVEKHLTTRELIEEEIRKADEAQKGEASVLLPKTYDDGRISFRKQMISGGKVAFLFLLVAVAVIVLFLEKDKEKRKKRDEELEAGYAKLVAKIASYLDAGMSTRNTWLKIAEDYKKQRKTGRELSYLYEEMLVTANEMNSGKPESLAYSDFGRRCGQHAYVKLSNLLSQNLKQGVSGLKQALREEVAVAQEQRKNAALKKGEEAGTKQLFPMLLMLGIVIVVLVVPVFMSF